VLHLLDRSWRHFLANAGNPNYPKAVMQPILVDGGKLVPQASIEIFDDSCVALHVYIPPRSGRDCRSLIESGSKTGATRGSRPHSPLLKARSVAVPAAWATGTAGRNGLVHDAADGARAAAALGAAAEAVIDLPGRARCIAATSAVRTS